MTTPADVTYEITQLIPAPPGTFAVFCTETMLWLEPVFGFGIWTEHAHARDEPATHRAGRAGPLRVADGAFVPAAHAPAYVGLVSGDVVDVVVVRDGASHAARGQLDAGDTTGVNRLERAVCNWLAAAGVFRRADVLTSWEARAGVSRGAPPPAVRR